MDTMSLDTITRLAEPASGLRVSIFMPTQRFAPGSQEADSLRLKNLLRDAQAGLETQGMRATDAERILAPAQALLGDLPFWLRSREGLAILLGEDTHEVLQLDIPVPKHVYVGDRFWLRPLMPLLGRNDVYWVLALSQNRVRLLKGNHSSLAEVPTEEIPPSLAEAFEPEEYQKASLQFHTGTPDTGGRRAAVFHGNNEPDYKSEIVRFFREIDRGLHDHLGRDHDPLILAGVDYLIPIYREISNCPSLLADSVSGNPDALGEQALHELSWPIAEEKFGRAGNATLKSVQDAWTSPLVATEPLAIMEAAAAGRIASLLIADTAGWWSRAEEDASVVPHEGNFPDEEDLLETAALDTLSRGGEVLFFPAERMPDGVQTAALLRY